MSSTAVLPSRPDVLYLVHRVPYPPDKGDRIRAFHLLRFLSRHAMVHVACLADEAVDDRVIPGLQRYCKRVAVVQLGAWARRFRALISLVHGGTATEGAFYAPAVWTTLKDWTRQTPFQACLLSSSGLLPYLQLEELRHTPVVVDLVDVDSQKWLDYAAANRGVQAWLYRTEGRRLRRLEQGLPAQVRAVTLVSEAEADLYRGFCVQGLVHAVTNGVDLDYFQPRAEVEEPACVFVGALDYRPNIEGVCWFCREVWPKILQQEPEGKLYLVGRRPARAIRRLGHWPGIELIGPVPDVRPYLARAAVAIVPLQLARGVQNKLLEALAMGKATVVSPQALQGVPAQPGVHVLAASSPQEWVEAVLRLLKDQALRQQLGAAARSYVEEHCQWDQCLAAFAPLLGISLQAHAEDKSLTSPHPNEMPVCR